ncbi:MAG TPA: SEC-C domain-containing protein [Pseudonocardiaceae bacterium]|jgi:hypothetical protein
MPSTGLLTTDDLDEIGCFSFNADESSSVVGELVDAVEQGRVADQSDTAYALLLAAEITERDGDLPAAAALAERAVEANRTQGDPDYGYPRAFHAGLLLKLGRDDEAMAELKTLRPKLTEDVGAVSYVSSALEEGGRAETAEQWLTGALFTALQHREELAVRRWDPDYTEAATVAFTLAQHRYRLRRDLDLPRDDYDGLAENLLDAVRDALADEEGDDDGGIAALYWPRPEFERLLQHWPDLGESYGHTWDEHRSDLQSSLQRCAESGHTRLMLLAGSVDELAEHAERSGGDPTDPQIRQHYAEQLAENPREIAWPPGRNQACWCGSGAKYKKCCLPRTRD